MNKFAPVEPLDVQRCALSASHQGPAHPVRIPARLRSNSLTGFLTG
jgi:hypothetical protein